MKQEREAILGGERKRKMSKSLFWQIISLETWASQVRSGKESACPCRTRGFSPWVRKVPGEGNGNPLQYYFFPPSFFKKLFFNWRIIDLQNFFFQTSTWISHRYTYVPAWEIPWTAETGEPQSMGSQRVTYDWICTIRYLKSIELTNSH